LIGFNKELGYHPLNVSLVGSCLSSWHYYKDPKEQVASVFLGIAKNHAFQDGNKRTAVIFYYTACDLLSIHPVSEDDLFRTVVEIAANKFSVEEVAKKIF
jgi:death-on-curing family protein